MIRRWDSCYLESRHKGYKDKEHLDKFDQYFPRSIPTTVMDAIKKKMQAMKIEKDNAMDRTDMSERACKVKTTILSISVQ